MGTSITGTELAGMVSNFVNSFTADTKEVTSAILKDHPTLQQSTIRLCFDVIRAMADQNRIDERNSGSVSACKLIIELCGNEMYLPFI